MTRTEQQTAARRRQAEKEQPARQRVESTSAGLGY